MKYRPAAFAVIAVGVGFLVVLLVVSIIQTRSLVGAVREQQQVNTGTVDLIKDCTQPKGHCFKQGQRRTAAAVVGINQGTLRVIVAALTCQRMGLTDGALAACTTRKATR